MTGIMRDLFALYYMFCSLVVMRVTVKLFPDGFKNLKNILPSTIEMCPTISLVL